MTRMNWATIGDMITVLLFIIQSSHADCTIGLGMITGDIRDSQITASSSYSTWTRPSAGRLWNNRRVHDSTLGGWCAEEEDGAPYLQVDFKKETVITAIATQGLNYPLGNWVDKYSLNYSCDGLNWRTYRSFNKDKVLKGNIDGDSIVTNKLDEAIIARVIRINALQWNMYGIVCMRVEMYGCDTEKDGRYKDCSMAAGMENRQISDNQVTASSFASGHHPSQGRVNNVFKHVNGSALWGSWCAGIENTSQYIQIDLTEIRNISGVATQGSVMGTWVTEYTLNYSMDGSQWETYCNQSGSGAQILQGNSDTLTVHKNMFERRISARYIRFNPRAWTPVGQICMRVEIYLCHTYEGCPRIPSTSTTVTSHQITSVQSDITAATKMNTFTEHEHEPVTNRAWQMYSSGFRNTASFSVWITVLVGWALIWIPSL